MNYELKDSLLRGAKLLGGVWSQEQDLRGEKHTSEDAEVLSARKGLFNSNPCGHNCDATSVTYSDFVRHEAVEVTLVA